VTWAAVLPQDRMRLCYRTSLAYFFRFPEVWHEFAQYEAETGESLSSSPCACAVGPETRVVLCVTSVLIPPTAAPTYGRES
jgi:hypothetical protein